MKSYAAYKHDDFAYHDALASRQGGLLETSIVCRSLYYYKTRCFVPKELDREGEITTLLRPWHTLEREVLLRW